MYFKKWRIGLPAVNTVSTS